MSHGRSNPVTASPVFILGPLLVGTAVEMLSILVKTPQIPLLVNFLWFQNMQLKRTEPSFIP